MIMKKRVFVIHTEASVQRIQAEEDGQYSCVFVEKEKEYKATAQYVLCAIGRCPNTDGLFGEGVEPEMERGRVVVDENFGVRITNIVSGAERLKSLR